ncbi:MAG: trypsin-like peptidase domain-containing protein [Desulfobulbaceae bacterium]|jgi:S1-C subfamily serine protease|nr:trypsin-like peptidase domain-containing protein [Desulfobulbaceae bacterium]
MALNRRLSFIPLVWFLVIASILWFLFFRPETFNFKQDAVPRAVTARGDLASDEQNGIELFASISPSVVYITSVEVVRNFFSLNADEIPKGTGSGFVWDKEGRIVTNYHVIEDASRIHVTLEDNTTWKAVLIGASPEKDLAVLQISAPAAQLHPIPVGESHNLLVGQRVYAIGNPFGLDHTLTSGIVSALGREITSVTGITIEGVIQTDAAINPGNSGGPLLDSAGRLIGVNTAIYSPAGVSSGIGFAVAVDQVNNVVPDLITYGKVLKPSLGISIATPQLSKRFDIDGVLVINVEKGSSAEKAGILGTKQQRGQLILGDIIIGINGNEIHDQHDLARILNTFKIADVITLQVIRNKEKFQVDVVLEPLG